MKALKFISAFGLTICVWFIASTLLVPVLGSSWDYLLDIEHVVGFVAPPLAILALSTLVPNSPWRLGVWWGVGLPIAATVAFYGWLYYGQGV
jgi:hypothetical protein